LEPIKASGRESWYDVFLRDLAARGLLTLAAAKAGIHRSRVYRHMEVDPEFAAEVDVAREYYADHLEWQSVALGQISRNPLPFFARLKAERPARYIDRQAVLVGTSSDLDPQEGKAILQAMLGVGTSATHQALRQSSPAPEPSFE
jgi:hypothetical protein